MPRISRHRYLGLVAVLGLAVAAGGCATTRDRPLAGPSTGPTIGKGAADPAPGGQPCLPDGNSTGSAAGVPATIATGDASRGHTEPAIAVSRMHPNNLLGAAEFVVPGRNARLVPGVFSSADGGRSWHTFGPLPLPPGYARGDDVSAAFDGATGLVAAEVYPAADKSTGASAAPGSSSVLVWRTVDGGRYFAAATALEPREPAF
jgi:hypothetical protein